MRWPAFEDEERTSQGIALVAVLWVVLALSIMAAILLSETRGEARFVRTSIAVAQAEALADAGIYRAAAALLAAAPGDRPAADGRSYLWTFGASEILLSIQDENGKIDLNIGADDVLRGLLTSVGVAGDKAQVLVDRIRDFADPDHLERLHGAEDQDYRAAGLMSGAKDWRFASVDELYQVLGMPPELVAAVAGALTVYATTERPDPRVAPREALMALPGARAEDVDAWLANVRPGRGEAVLLDDRRSEEQPAAPGERSRSTAMAGGQERGLVPAVNSGLLHPSSGGQVFTVRSEVAMADGARFVREAVVELTGDPAQPFVFHEWRRGDSPSPVESS